MASGTPTFSGKRTAHWKRPEREMLEFGSEFRFRSSKSRVTLRKTERDLARLAGDWLSFQVLPVVFSCAKGEVDAKSFELIAVGV